MSDTYTMLDVTEIHYDAENPRIRMALEKFGDSINAERIRFALKSGPSAVGTSSYSSLRDSIRAAGGITIPITVVSRAGSLVCIDGNTRLAIYKDFLAAGAPGNWQRIRAILREDADQPDIERIRVTAHLVGAREWPPYEKARYLHDLRNRKYMDYTEIIELCGGNKTDIERQIDAFDDMNTYYRPIVQDDTDFMIDRFSGFKELQAPGIKDAIYSAGYELQDFGEWIRDGKIYRLQDVRKLPKVLADPEATSVFVDGGPRSIESAVRLLDQRRSTADAGNLTLTTATIYQLAEVLARRIDDLPYSEIRALKNRGDAGMQDEIDVLESLSANLNDLLIDVRE